MKYINLKTVSITLGLVILFSYQPPINSYAKTVQTIKINLPKIDTVKFEIDTLLMDSLLTLKTKFEVAKIESEVILEEMSEQQHQLLKLKGKK